MDLARTEGKGRVRNIKEARDEMVGGVRSDERWTSGKTAMAAGKGEEIETVRRDTVHLSRCSAYRAKTSFLSFPRCPPAMPP